jgi:hypothetical protein
MLYLSCPLIPHIACLVILSGTVLLGYPDCGYLELPWRKILYLEMRWKGTRSSFVPEERVPQKNMTGNICSSLYLRNKYRPSQPSISQEAVELLR